MNGDENNQVGGIFAGNPIMGRASNIYNEYKRLQKMWEDWTDDAGFFSNLSAGIDMLSLVPAFFGAPWATPLIRQAGDAGIAMAYDTPEFNQSDFLYIGDEAQMAYDQFTDQFGDMGTYQPFGEDLADTVGDLASWGMAEAMGGAPGEGASWWQTTPAVTDAKDMMTLLSADNQMQSYRNRFQRPQNPYQRTSFS
jgi:hypothetical protein